MTSPDGTSVTDNAIAVIGMAGRFPGAGNLAEFWRNLCEGVESVRFFPEDELLAEGVDPEILRRPNYVKAAPVLDGADLFDAEFFGFNPREAEITDPQQRLFLECAWEALENAGYDPHSYGGAIGVFGGTNLSCYLLNNLLKNPRILDALGFYQICVANVADFLATRVAYKLDLRGPAVTVGTACSTSLVAVHLACQSVIGFECDLALAGGSCLKPPQNSGYLYQEGGILSPDGHCRVFDERAEGTIFGNGVGIVVLKRLKDALEQGDRIEAVIRGSAVNNDGAEKVGFTAPSVNGQARVVAEALAVAGVSAESISYIEAHGTGTALGDPIEIEALTKVFRHETSARSFCAIGSVKSNIGHLDAAAGAAALIKTVLSLKHHRLPPSLHFVRPNPRIDFESTPFVVNRQLRDWETQRLPRRAGVSAFGFGGTNAHIVLEEAPAVVSSEHSRPFHLIPLSARTGKALEQTTDNLVSALRDGEDLRLADVAFTLQVGRRSFTHRRVAVCRDREDAVRVLGGRDPKRCLALRQEHEPPRVAFMFPGQGSQYVGMARELFDSEPLFREEVDRCSLYLEPSLEFDLRSVLYPDPVESGSAAERLMRTSMAQPVIFVISYALARLWMHWGVRPHALIGHSVGEYVAACLAGVMSLESALRLVAARGRLMGSMPPGVMIAVPMSPQDLDGKLEEEMVIAAVNAPGMCVVSGPREAAERFVALRKGEGIPCRELHTSHAFHSPMMDPIVEPFRREVEGVELAPPELPIMSTVTGERLSAEEATDPGYWARNLRQTVRFSQAMSRLLEEERLLLLEVGPGNALGTFATQNPARSQGHATLGSLRHPQDPVSDYEFLAGALARLWLSGISLDWNHYYERERRVRVALPTYPFQKTRCWIEPAVPEAPAVSDTRAVLGVPVASIPSGPDAPTREKPAPRGEGRVEPAWFSRVVWEEAEPWEAGPAAQEPSRVLILSVAGNLALDLAAKLRHGGASVSLAAAGTRFSETGPGEYALDVHDPEQYEKLANLLAGRGGIPDAAVVVGAIGSGSVGDPRPGREMLSGLMHLVHALGPRSNGGLRMFAVTSGAHAARDGEAGHPGTAMVSAVCKVIPQEYPGIGCRHVDLDPGSLGRDRDRAVDRLAREMRVDSLAAVVAHRDASRWIPRYRPAALAGLDGVAGKLRERGVYLITGGLGGIGLTLAEHLARECRARLALLGRSGLPDRSEWDTVLSMADRSNPLRQRVAAVRRLEELGAEPLVLAADVSRLEEMVEVKSAIKRRFGEIHGIVHAAGVAGSGRIASATRERVDAVLAPKVDGALVLAELFSGSNLDFVVLSSSLASILGGSGLADYCAANQFLDAFARTRAFGDGTPVISINWPAWREVGMASRDLEAAEGVGLELGSITPAEAVASFDRIVRGSDPQVIVSPQPLDGVIEWVDSLHGTGGGRREPGPRGASRPAPAAEESAEELLISLWRDLLGVEEVGLQDNFFELGGNSLLAVRLFEKVEEKVGLQYPVATIFQSPTVTLLAELIRKSGVGQTGETPSREPRAGPEHLVAMRGTGTRPPLLLVHDIGGGILNYRTLVDHLGEDQPVYGLIARGFDGRKEPSERVEEMAAAYVEELLAEHPRGPYYIGGFSFGAQVAYEMARQLSHLGHAIGMLVIFDQPPANWRSLYRKWRPSRIVNFLVNLPYWTAEIIEQEPVEILFRLRKKFIILGKLIARESARGGREAPRITMDDLRRNFAALPEVRRKLQEAEHQAAGRYFPKPFPGQVTLFRGTRQSMFGCHDTELGWGPLALGGVEVHRVAANHHQLFREPYVRELASKLTTLLEQVRLRGGGPPEALSSAGDEQSLPAAAPALD